MTQWITDWYAVVDQMDADALSEVTSPDIKVTFANYPTTEGSRVRGQPRSRCGGRWTP
jgi:hypothetical protein